MALVSARFWPLSGLHASSFAARTRWTLPLASPQGQRNIAPGDRTFRLSSEASSAGLQVIIVRHGQSTNNLIQDEVEQRMRNDGLPADEAASIWMSKRVHDPELSAKGHQEAFAAAQELARYLGKDRGVASLVVPSPMLRALQTAAPIVEALKCPCTVSPLVYETGGMYARAGQGFISKPGLAAADISRLFPSYQTDELVPSGPWNGTSAKETFEQSIVRAQAAAQWIKTSEHTKAMLARSSQAQGPLILVIHSTFIDLLLKALLNYPHTDSAGVMHVSNCSLTELFLPAAACAHGGGHEAFATLQYLNRDHHVP